MQHFNDVMWSPPLGLPGQCDICIHEHSTSGIKRKENENKKVTLHILTHGAMRGCMLTSWVVCINDKLHDIRERNVKIRSEIWTINIRSLGFQDIREWVTLWGLILGSLGCTKLVLHIIVRKINQLKPIYLDMEEGGGVSRSPLILCSHLPVDWWYSG